MRLQYNLLWKFYKNRGTKIRLNRDRLSNVHHPPSLHREGDFMNKIKGLQTGFEAAPGTFFVQTLAIQCKLYDLRRKPSLNLEKRDGL